VELLLDRRASDWGVRSLWRRRRELDLERSGGVMGHLILLRLLGGREDSATEHVDSQVPVLWHTRLSYDQVLEDWKNASSPDKHTWTKSTTALVGRVACSSGRRREAGSVMPVAYP